VRVTCSQDSLHRALAVAGRAVATKSTLPILGNYLLEAAHDTLSISATNLEFGISCHINATVAQAGRTTLQARVLSDFVANLPAGEVELSDDANPLLTLVRSGQSQAHLRGIDPDDFPRLISNVEGGAAFTIDPAVLREAISHVVFAAATDDSRPVLAGVQLDVRDGAIALSAADGFRMSLRSVALEDGPSEPLTIIVPAKALQELSRVLADVADPVTLQVTPNQSQMLVTAAGVRFSSRLIDGAFPDLKQVVPKQWNTRTVVRRETLLDATKRAAIFARTNNDVIRLAMAPAEDGFDMGRVTITANAADTGDNQDDVDASVEGGEVQIAFNGRYLSDVLGVMRGSEVAFELMGPNSAGVIKSVETDDFTHVIMPMVIGSN
jgi:DNA polymerase-3 subunit beta